MILSIQRRKEALHVGDLGKVIDDDIRIMRMSGQEVLMIALRGIKAGVLFNTGDYGLAKRMRGRQLRDISPGHVSLRRSEEHTSELQSLMRSSYAVICLKKKNKNK